MGGAALERCDSSAYTINPLWPLRYLVKIESLVGPLQWRDYNVGLQTSPILPLYSHKG
jgi:hypothetical protein